MKTGLRTLLIAALLTLPTRADPISDLEKSWEFGRSQRAWSQLEQLERTERSGWEPSQRRRFHLQRARMRWLRHPDLAQRDLQEALTLSATPSQKARILLWSCRIQNYEDDTRQAYRQALELYETSGGEDVALGAELTFTQARLALRAHQSDPANFLHLIEAARAFEQIGAWSDAGRAWVELAKYQDQATTASFQGAETYLARALHCAHKAQEPPQWLQLTTVGPRLSKQLTRNWILAQPRFSPELKALLLSGSHQASWGEVLDLAHRGQEPEIELYLLERMLKTAPTIAQGQKVFQRALALCQAHPELYERPHPWVKAPTTPAQWHLAQASLYFSHGEVRQAIQSARIAAQGWDASDPTPEALEAACKLLQFYIESHQSQPALNLARDLRSQIARIADTPLGQTCYNNYRRTVSPSNYDASALATRINQEHLAQRQFIETVYAHRDRGPAFFRNWMTSMYRVDTGQRQLILEELQQEVHSSQGRRRSEVLRELARQQEVMGDLKAASQTLKAALDSAIELKHLPMVAIAASAWAALQCRLDHPEQGAQLLSTLLADPHTASGNPALLWTQLGRCQHQLKQFAPAAASFAQAANLYRNDGAPWEKARRWSLISEQINSLHAAGDRAQAQTLLGEMLRQQTSTTAIQKLPILLRLARLQSQPPLQQLESLTRRALEELSELPELSPPSRAAVEDSIELVIQILLQRGRSQEAEDWLRRLENVRLLQSQLGNRRSPEALELDELRGGLAQLSSQIESSQDEAQRLRLNETRERERKLFTHTLERLRSRYPEYDRLLSLRLTELPQLQSQLGDDILAVQFFAAPDGIYVLSLSGQQRISRFSPIPREQLKKCLHDALREISEGRPSPASEQLSEILLTPLGPLLHGKTRLLVLPSGELSQFPLDALRWEGELLAQRISIGHVYASDLRPQKHRWERLLALGEPTGVDLPGTGKEVSSLATLFPHAHILRGSQATLEQLAHQCETADIVHLASHAGGDPEHPETLYLQLSGRPLTIEETMNLKLRPGCLVFLSACRSGQSSHVQLRELTSLAHAFRAAGAGAVISTLWPIDDEASVVLVQEFYRQLRQGAPTLEALHRAKNALRTASTSSPLTSPPTSPPPSPALNSAQHWAAFQVLGNDW